MNHKTEVTRKQSKSNFPINGHFLPPDTHTYGKKCSFFGKFGVHSFFVTSVLWFVFLRYYRRVNIFTFSPSRGSHLTFQSPDPYAQSKVFLEEQINTPFRSTFCSSFRLLPDQLWFALRAKLDSYSNRIV